MSTINIDVINEIDEAFAIPCHQFDLLEDCKNDLNNAYGLKLLTLNIRSIGHNFDSFCIALTRLAIPFDVIVLTECWLQCCPLVGQIPGYNDFQTQNNLNRNGGVTVYVKNFWNASSQELHLSDAEGLSIEIANVGTILAMYRSPSFLDKSIFLDSLNLVLKSYENSPLLILAGDININILDPSDHDTSQYLDILADSNMLPAITQPTRINTCIDHIFVKSQTTQCFGAIAHSDITDHSLCMLGLSLTKPKPCTRYCYKTDFEAVAEDLRKVNWSSVMSAQNVDTASTLLDTTICTSVKKYTSKKIISRTKCILKPWMTPGLLRCTKHKDRLHLDSRRNPTDSVKALVYKRYRNFLTDLLHRLKNEYETAELTNGKNNPKELWKCIKRISNAKTKSNSATELVKVRLNIRDSANYCNEYFANIGDSLANRLLSQKNCTQEDLLRQTLLGSPTPFSFFLQPTDASEVNHVIMQLKNDSAAGLDGISPKLLKAIKPVIITPLTHVLNLSIGSGTFPSNWKRSMVVPIYKSGDKKTPENYRPISLLGIFSKILEKIVNKRLQKYLEQNSLLSPRQFGFRHKMSTEDAVNTLVESVADHLEGNRKCIGAFLDLAKAFDTVPVELLLKKLENIGIRGLPLEWFRSYLTDRRQCVRLDQVVSDELPIRFGVPQGSVLGPTLFNIFLNNIHEVLPPDAEAICYADDTVVLFSDKSWEGAILKAEQGLGVLKGWLDGNLLTLNASKTKYLCFHKTKSSAPNFPTVLRLHYDCDQSICSCQIIDRASDIKYLGIVVDENLSFKKHIGATAARIRKLIYVMKLLRSSADLETLRLVYTSLGESLISYCIPVWGGSGVTAMLILERAQRAVLKTMCGKPYRYPTIALFKETQVLSVRQLYTLKMCLKTHRKVLNSTMYPDLCKKRVFKIPTVSVKTAFAQRLPCYMSPHIYNRVAKKCNIKDLTVGQAKKSISSLLLSMNYQQTESLISRLK